MADQHDDVAARLAALTVENERLRTALNEACRLIPIISPYGGSKEVERIREIAQGTTPVGWTSSHSRGGQ